MHGAHAVYFYRPASVSVVVRVHKPALSPIDETSLPQPEAAGVSVVRLRRLTTALRADADQAVIPGAVLLIVRNDHLVAFEAFGHLDAALQRPMHKDSIFRIASMTKPLTVAAALTFMEEGKLLLNDPVSRYLPEFAQMTVGIERGDPASGEHRLGVEPALHAMTIQDLMRHTAGFTYGQFGDSLVQRAYRDARLIDDQQTNAEMAAKLARLPLAHQPGTTFEYGMSTDVLGRVVEVIAGCGLDRVLAERITGPLGMKDTAFGIQPRQQHRLAEPLRDSQTGGGIVMIPYDPARTAKWFSGGGGLVSTAADYLRFTQMLLNDGEFGGERLLARHTVRLMLANHLPAGLNYGPRTSDLGLAAPLPRLGQGYGLGLGVRTHEALGAVPGLVGDFYWGGALGPYFWVDRAEGLIVIFMLQELSLQRRARYRSLLRTLVYQALR